MPADVTQLLNAIEEGDPHVAKKLLPLIYEELRRLAASKMSLQPAGHTLQATALVHEACLRISRENHRWENRRHFFTAAAEAMRRILVDQARRKQRLKRGGPQERLSLDEIDIAIETGPDELLRGHDALAKLAEEDALEAECVAFSPDGKRLASASTDQTVKVWDATPRSQESTPDAKTR